MKKVILTAITGILVGIGMASFGVWALLYGTEQDQRLFYRLGVALSIICSAIAIHQGRLSNKSRLRMEAERLRYEEGHKQYEEASAAMRRAQQSYEDFCRRRPAMRDGGPVGRYGYHIPAPEPDLSEWLPEPLRAAIEPIEPIHPQIEWDTSWPSALGPGNAQMQ